MKKIFTLIAAAVVAMTASAQQWKAAAGDLAKGATLLDNNYVTITTGVQDSKAGQILDENQAAITKSIGDYTFNYQINVRVTDAPAAGNNWEGTAYTECDPVGVSLVVAPKANVDLTLYYGHGDGKAVSCTDITTNEAVAITETASGDGYTGLYKFQKDHKYVIYARGGTTTLWGMNTAAGTYVEPANKVYGYVAAQNSVTYGDGATMAITGNTEKSFASAGTIKGTTSIKNSNGAQMTFTAATGKNIKSVTFYFAANKDEEEAKLTEVNGETIDGVSALGKIHSNPASYTYNFTAAASQFTFTFTNKQANFILDVTYGEATAVAEVSAAESQVAPAKFVKNGKVVIAKGDKLFNAAGAQIK